MSSADTHIVPGLSDREACADALYRLLQGTDDNDMDLVRSAWSTMGVLVLPQLEPGKERASVHGIDAFIESLQKGVGGMMETLHVVGNIRTTVKGNTARTAASGLSSHFTLGEGKKPDKKGYHVGSRFLLDLERKGDGVWIIEKMELEARWIEGNDGVLAVMEH